MTRARAAPALLLFATAASPLGLGSAFGAPAPAAPASASVSPPPASVPSAVGSIPSRAPAPSASSTPVDPRPFGPGVRVAIECDQPGVFAYVAKGAVDTRPDYPDPFVRAGRLPAVIELPPGVYTVLAEGEAVPSGSTYFEVRARPVRVRVSAGSQSIRDVSTLLLATGSAAVLAGLVVMASYAQDEDAGSKRAVAVPLLAGGGVGAAFGLGLVVWSATGVDSDSPPSAPQKAAALGPVRLLGLAGRF
jgi:hypothetical protein